MRRTSAPPANGSGAPSSLPLPANGVLQKGDDEAPYCAAAAQALVHSSYTSLKTRGRAAPRVNARSLRSLLCSPRAPAACMLPACSDESTLPWCAASLPPRNAATPSAE